MNNNNILIQRLENFGGQLMENIEIDLRMRVVGDGRKYIFVSIHDNDENTCLFAEGYNHETESPVDFCDRVFDFCFTNNLFRRPIDLIIVHNEN